MRKIILSFLLVLFILTAARSQQQEFILPALTLVHNVQWRDSAYLFTQFQKGELIFDTGFRSKQTYLLNYNLFTERMDMISSKGDTTALEEVTVQHTIRAGGYVFHFFPKKGYLRIIESGKVSLAILEFFNGYLVANSSNGYSSKKGRIPLQVDNRTQPFEYDRAYVRQGELYLIADNKFYRAIKPALLKVYDENKGVVKLYLDKHSVSFNHPDSLSSVIHFLNELRNSPEDKIPGLFRVKAGDAIRREWSDSLYLFTHFMKADVKTSGNKSANPVPMNYNLLTGEMDYINADGDTLQFNSRSVTTVSFDDRLLYKQQAGGFAEVLLQGPETLVEVKQLKIVQQESNPDKVHSKPFLSDGEAIEDRLCVIETFYLFIDRNRHSSPADRVGFIRAFPSSKKQIDEYLINHPVNFNNKKDLRRLFSFCMQF